MARPRTINPKGTVRHLTVRVSEPVASELQREAKNRNVSVGTIIREHLQRSLSQHNLI